MMTAPFFESFPHNAEKPTCRQPKKCAVSSLPLIVRLKRLPGFTLPASGPKNTRNTKSYLSKRADKSIKLFVSIFINRKPDFCCTPDR